jgi:hypothetical protein
MKKKRSHARAAGQTTITVSLPKEVYDYVCTQALAEDRSRSNWIVSLVRKAMRESGSQTMLCCAICFEVAVAIFK